MKPSKRWIEFLKALVLFRALENASLDPSLDEAMVNLEGRGLDGATIGTIRRDLHTRLDKLATKAFVRAGALRPQGEEL